MLLFAIEMYQLEKPVKAIDFEAINLEGEKVRLSDFFGKIIVLEFWGTRCPYCHKMIKELNAIKSKFKKDVVIFAVNTDLMSPKDLAKYKEKNNVKYALYTVSSPRVFAMYGLRGVPTVFLIDSKGFVRFLSFYVPASSLEKAIMKLRR